MVIEDLDGDTPDRPRLCFIGGGFAGPLIAAIIPIVIRAALEENAFRNAFSDGPFDERDFASDDQD